MPQNYGWLPVPRDTDVLFKDHPTASGTSPKQIEFSLNDLPFPDSPLIQHARAFVKQKLTEPTFNHSERVFIYGSAVVKTHFLDWDFDEETYYLSCLLHDIGTADAYLKTTKMSFEFKGGIVARDVLLNNQAHEDQADAVCEAVIRHQDIFVKGGNITQIGQVLQLATIIDNVGLRANLLHPTLFELATKKFPRLDWSNCFAKVIYEEENAKPWCHTTTFEGANWKPGQSSNFATDVLANEVTGKRFE